MQRDIMPGLDRKRLIAASFEVLDLEGLEGLSMRRLASHLGVQAPAIYWHVRDKAELLGIMAREIYTSAYDAQPIAQNWREWLMAFGHAMRASFLKHRDGARLCAIATPSSHVRPHDDADRLAAQLEALGLEQQIALSFQAAVISYALGWATFEANGPMHDFLDRIMAFDDNFAVGLEALVDGLHPRLVSRR